MFKRLLHAIIAALFGSLSAFASDPLVGEYAGAVENFKIYPYEASREMVAQISRHKDGYKLRIMPEFDKRSDVEVLACGLKPEGGVLKIENEGRYKFCGAIGKDGGQFTCSAGNKSGVVRLKKIERKSPTLGEKAPEGAIILFDGSGADEWENERGGPCVWKISSEEKSMTVARAKDGGEKGKNQTIQTKRKFSDFKIHIEFKLPHMPDRESQDRANSGFFTGPYEVQILDSFGAEGSWNDCGAVYRIAPPQANASLPPETWQTFDIEFTAPKFENGKAVEYAKVSVWHNGVKVQSQTEYPHGTSCHQPQRKSFLHPRPPYKLKLQDHGNPVSFRNIWIVEK
ncbi:MAG: DUF1080 domain-containing protein [Opitutales bacterium]|nr:DUF1080 domain-containing protein [Opitutales bacterium]